MLPAVVILLAGCWRDWTGRNKPIMYMALIGEITGVAIELLAACQWTFSPWATSIADAVISGIAGGSKLFSVGATLVITDNSDAESRTARLGVFVAANVAGASIALGISGYLLEYFGYKWLFATVICIHIFNLLLILNIKENERKLAEGAPWQSIKKLKTVVQPRPNNLVIWLMVISSCLATVSVTAEGNLFLYYLQQGFKFMVTGAGMYTSYRMLIGVVSSILTPPVFSKFLKLSDFKIGIISALLSVVSGIAMAFAKTAFELLLFAWLDFLKILLFTVPKSVITKSVSSDEIGVFLSLCSIGECVLPIGMFYLYDAVFNATSSTMPGAIFLASAGINFLIFILLSISMWIYSDPVPVLLENKKTDEKDLEKQEKN